MEPPFPLLLKWPLHTFLHTNCIMPKLCSFMLNYASYANIMPIMLYAPAMLLCQFLCWHNPLGPSDRDKRAHDGATVAFDCLSVAIPRSASGGAQSSSKIQIQSKPASMSIAIPLHSSACWDLTQELLRVPPFRLTSFPQTRLE